ncbi:MAG: hypothetical protein ABIU97_01795 [Dehalococcoidia bacterium]
MPDNLAAAPLTMCMSKVTLAAGTTTTISNTGTTLYMIKGFMYTKTAMTNVATPTVDSARNDAAFRPIVLNQGTVFIVGFDKDGNVKVGQGTIEALDVSGNFIRKPQNPILRERVAPVGRITVKGGATLSGTWTFGSSNLSGVTGVTYTFEDIGMNLDRP